MKKILIIISLALSFGSELHAQITRFDTCQYINQFNGEWMYANGNDTIRIYLRSHRGYFSDPPAFEDRIFGWHEYKQGNTVIESTYENRFMQLMNVADTITSRSFSIWLKMGRGQHCNPTVKEASGTIRDYLQNNEIKVVRISIDPTGTQLTWNQRHKEGYGVFSGATGMTLPRDFILTKQ